MSNTNAHPFDANITRIANGTLSRMTVTGQSTIPLLMMAGEDGTLVFLEDTSVSLVDAISGLKRCTATPLSVGSGMLPLAVGSDQTALLWRYSGTMSSVVRIDHSCEVVDSQDTDLALTDWRPLHVATDAVVGVAGDGSLIKLTTRPYIDRTVAPSDTGQSNPVRPTLILVMPENNPTASQPFHAADAKERFEAAIDATHAAPQSFVHTQATLGNFLQSFGDIPGFQTAVKGSHVEAVAFIGHTVDIQTSPGVTRSVGLQLYDRDLIKQQPLGTPTTQLWLQIPPNPTPEQIAAAQARVYRKDKIYTQARVVFIASCYLGEEFESLWEINDDRVLVIPENPNVSADLLVASKYAWPAFAAALSRGQTIDEAIQAANDSCWVDPDTATDPNHPICGINDVNFRRVGGKNVISLYKTTK